jgi:hypothetical protein
MKVDSPMLGLWILEDNLICSNNPKVSGLNGRAKIDFGNLREADAKENPPRFKLEKRGGYTRSLDKPIWYGR